MEDNAPPTQRPCDQVWNGSASSTETNKQSMPKLCTIASQHGLANVLVRAMATLKRKMDLLVNQKSHKQGCSAEQPKPNVRAHAPPTHWT